LLVIVNKKLLSLLIAAVGNVLGGGATLTNSNEKEKNTHTGWNPRENKRNLGLYVILILMCLVLGWVLGSTGH